MTPGRLRRGRAVVGALLLLVTVGCSALPESGPIRRDTSARSQPPEEAEVTPAGPGRGDSPVEVANGFLTAMTGNPLTTAVARSFLSQSAQSSWNPNRATVVYQVSSANQTPEDVVRVRLSDTQRLDSRGGWIGTAAAGDRQLRLRMVRERGQWRIANPPDAVIIPEWYLESRFRPFNLYFFDQTERVLVPDRVYIQRGEQTSSTLVRALLSGPGADVAPVTRTEFPPQTQLDLSVPVAPDGTAAVPFSDQLLKLSPQRLTRAVAQLAWTLRQVPGVTRLRMTVGDTTVPLPDGRRDFSVEEGDAFAPTVQGADDHLFGLRKGHVVAIRDGAEQAVPGPFGRPGFALRSIGVRLDAKAIAAVASDHHTVFVGPSPGAAPPKDQARAVHRVYHGSNVLPPAYDLFGGLWLVDRIGSGSRIVLVAKGQRTTVDIPGISGRRVTAFVLSRDGTRIVALVDGAGKGDRLLTANLLRSADGTFSRAAPATEIEGLPSDLGDLRDLAWRSPNDLAVLGRPSKGRSEVAFVTLDGSPGDPTTVPPDSWLGNAAGLTGSPDSSLPLYLVTPGHQLLRLDGSSRWHSSDVAKGLFAPTYAG
jgi:hypothetical protein